MLLKEFPDISWLKKTIAKDFAEKRSWDNRPLLNSGWPTAILNVKTKHTERSDIKGPFSLFLNKSGESLVRCNQKTVTVSSDTYVVSNNGQHYDLLIDRNQPVETFNIHFGEKLFADTVHALSRSDEDLLDNLESSSFEFNIPIRSAFRDETFNQLLLQVEQTYENDEKEHSLYSILAHLLTNNGRHFGQLKNMISLKSSTKEELIRRVYLSVDFIHSNYANPITLDQLAHVSMLSKFHFLRIFKSVFRLSPHQYIKHIRLQKAVELIRQQKLPLYLIAQQVGIENGSSLSRMMFQLTGRRPTAILSD